MKPGVGGWGPGAISLTVITVFLAACGGSRPLPVLGQVPEFELTSQTGKAFDAKSLAGHVWVADFVYTNCEGPCPMMSSKMHRLQVSTAQMPDVKLVSFTVDPARDTPPVLAAYSRLFKAEPDRWYFLTGEQSRLNDLGLNGFHLNSVDGSLEHSTRFVLVDRAGRIRGYYISTDDDFLPRLLRDIRQLEREKS